MGGGDIAFPNLGIYLKNVPQYINIFGLKIALYGVVIGIGMLLAFLLICKQAKRVGLSDEDFLDAGIYIVIFGVLGARLYYVIFSWDYYKDNPISILNIREGGLAIYGGVIAGFTTLIIYCLIKKKPLKAMADIAFQGVLVGQIVGRWGNFFNREVFGTYTNNLFAMRLPITAVRERDIDAAIFAHIEEGTNYIQVHPTFLYEGTLNLILLLIIIFMTKRKKYDGQLCLMYFGGYGIIRFIVEGIRTDQLHIKGTNIAVSQLLGLLLFVAALTLAIIARTKIAKAAILGSKKDEAKIEKIEPADEEKDEKIKEETAEEDTKEK